MQSGFDQVPSRFKPIGVERAITLLAHYRIQMVEIDRDNPRGLWIYLDNGQTLAIRPRNNRLEFGLADRPVV